VHCTSCRTVLRELLQGWYVSVDVTAVMFASGDCPTAQVSLCLFSVSVPAVTGKLQ
jgi:hypothetical protein